MYELSSNVPPNTNSLANEIVDTTRVIRRIGDSHFYCTLPNLLPESEPSPNGQHYVFIDRDIFLLRAREPHCTWTGSRCRYPPSLRPQSQEE